MIYKDGSFNVYAEDCTFPLQDLSLSSLHSQIDAQFSFSFMDINQVFSPFGLPWEPTKNTVFTLVVLYLGLMWNLARLMVQLLATKKAKYLMAIAEWHTHNMHVLLDV